MTDALIIDAVRTPFGRHGGALAAVRPDDLAALVLRALLERTGVAGGDVEDVILGCANQAGEDNRNVARMAALLAGLPEDGRRRHRQPPVRLGHGRDRVGRARDHARRRRRLPRRRRGVDEPRPVRDAEAEPRVPDRARGDGRHHARLAAREPAHGGAGPHRLARPDGGEPRRGSTASRARSRTRSRCAATPRRSRRSTPAGSPPSSCRSSVPGRRGDADRRRGRGAAARLLARVARAAAAGVRARRHRHRRQLEHAQRRRGRRPAHLAMRTRGRTGSRRWRACAAPRPPACRRGSWASGRSPPPRRRWSAPG